MKTRNVGNFDKQLFELLLSHFPPPSEPNDQINHAKSLKDCSSSIARAWVLGNAYYGLPRLDKPATKDQKAISSSANHLRNAVKRLKEVGFKGGQSLKVPARDIKGRWERIPFEPDVSSIDAANEIAVILDEIADTLDGAAFDISVVQEENGASRRGGTPFKGAERRVVERLVDIFNRFSNRKAGRVTDQGMTSGHFVELVSEVFEILGVEASADNIAKSVLANMEKTTKDH